MGSGLNPPGRGRSWMVLLAAVIGVTITARAGFWQLDRAAQKVALQTALEARGGMPALPQAQLARTLPEADAQHYRHVTLHGRWLPERTIFLENRQMAGRTGFYVVTPLLLSGAGKGDAVLVQRGFAPRDQLDRTRLPVVPSPAGDVEVNGLIAPPPSRLYEFSAVASGAIRQNLDPVEFASETGLMLRPVSVLQAGAADEANTNANAGDGLLRQWPLPAVDVQKHYGYAFQWFAMASTMTGLYVWFQLIRPRLRSRT
ncbi:SURF1 family protein [soil metagenome]